VERQRIVGWGFSVVEKLSGDLRKEFPKSRGFSPQNLWRMKQFYEAYRQKSILSTLSRELPWFHNVLIMNKASTEQEREFYLRACADNHWSFRELLHQIKSRA
jgi:predicted nuclease of restriction endonuclease-like (RecB) superfamily